METVLITGGTGLIGKQLSKQLIKKGYKVSLLSTNPTFNTDIPVYYWNIEKKEIDTEALTNADYIIHLAGANIGEKRWTNSRKQLIIDSRIKSTDLIFNTLKTTKNKVKAFISASAIGYYGAITSDKIFAENDPPANDFPGNVCRLWEQSAEQFKELGIRTVKLRTGVVLSNEGGALKKMMLPIKLGIGSAVGSGKQYIPWIHIDDLCNIYIKSIEDKEMQGAYNAVAPEHISNSNFTKTLASILLKPFWFPNIPSFALRFIFGELSGMLLKGSRISSEKIQKAGYSFIYPNLENALKNLTSFRGLKNIF